MQAVRGKRQKVKKGDRINAGVSERLGVYKKMKVDF